MVGIMTLCMHAYICFLLGTLTTKSTVHVWSLIHDALLVWEIHCPGQLSRCIIMMYVYNNITENINNLALILFAAGFLQVFFVYSVIAEIG